MTKLDGEQPAPSASPAFSARPIHWRYLYARLDLLDSGSPVSYQAIADRLGITRQAVWDMFQTAGFSAWVDGELRSAAQNRISSVLNRVGAIAERTGSVKHAELFLRATGEIRNDAAAPASNPVVQVSFVGIPTKPMTIDQWPGGVLPDGKRR